MSTHVWTHGEAAVANILKLAPKLWDLWRGDYIHMTFIIPQISLLSRHFLQTRYWLLLTLKCKNMLHIYVLHSIICKNLFLVSIILFSKHLSNYQLFLNHLLCLHPNKRPCTRNMHKHNKNIFLVHHDMIMK